jgi:hypothetical protein
MNQTFRLTALCGMTVLGGALTGAPDSQAADKASDFLIENWYVTEVIVFQRGPVMEMNSTERLIRTIAPPFPAAMRTFSTTPDQIGVGYDLDSLALTLPEFTHIEPGSEPFGESVAQPYEISEEQPPVTAPAAGDETTSAPTIEPVLEPDPLQEFTELVAIFEDQLREQSYRWLDQSEFLMSRDATLIERQRGNQILLHGRWLQPVPQRGQPQPLFIQKGVIQKGVIQKGVIQKGGIQEGSGISRQYQLEGTMAVTLGRYLHFQARLSYREPAFGQNPISLPASLSEVAQPTALPAPIAGHMVLQQSRRMRSAQVHYIDHPKLGVLVRIDPLVFPDDLVAEFEALQKTLE